MQRTTPVTLLAILVLLAAVALALAAAPLEPAQAALAPGALAHAALVTTATVTPQPAPVLRYSTVNSCACDVQPVATTTPAAVTPASETPVTQPLAASLRAGNRLGPIDDYIVYYGRGEADILQQFDLAIVQPDTLTAAELAAVQAAGTKVVAYLSVGEAEGGRPWWPKVDLDWLLGRNENWGSLYVDAGQPGWQDLLLDTAIPTILQDMPFDGLFLDTLDTVDVYPQTKAGMVQLVERMRERYPDLILLQNRGFGLLDETGPFIDAVMFESMSTDFDFSARTYSTVEREEEPAFVRDMAAKHGLVGLVLDYAPPDNLAAIRRSYERGRAYGFVPYVSTIELNRAFVHDLTTMAPDVRAVSVSFREAGADAALALVTLANYGLADATDVPVYFRIGRGHHLRAQTQLDVASGERVVWEVTWPQPPDQLTLVRVEAGDQVYETTYAGIAPPLDLAQQQLRSGNGPDLLAAQTAVPPQIDGELDEWTEAPAAVIDQAEQVGFVEKPELAWGGPADLSARTSLRWDDDHLYLAMDVTDDAIVQQMSGEGIWKGDHVELWLDTRLQADFAEEVAGDDDFQLGFSPGAADGSAGPDFFIWQPALSRTDYADKIAYAARFNDHGYQFEAAIPWQLLNAERPQAGLVYGISIEPSDTDTPGRAAQEVMMSTAPESPSHWGNPTLRNNLILQ